VKTGFIFSQAGALVYFYRAHENHTIPAIFTAAAAKIPLPRNGRTRLGFSETESYADLWEELMHVTRRNLAVAAALALSVPSLFSSPALAEAGDEAAVKQNVEALREALLKADKAQLERLTAEQLSYGHSDGRVQNKAEFIDGVMTRKATVKSLNFPDLKIAVTGDAAIVRHIYESESETDGKPNSVKIGTLGVWQKQGGNWKLLARQGYKLA
jgi:ketosteroid isomerase-like protein